MKTDSKKNKNDIGMSSQDIQANLGLAVTPRQFRRYIDAGLIPKSWIEKNANGHFLFYPPKNTKWEAMRQRIEQWVGLRYKRGWKKRPKKQGKWINPSDKSTAIVTIEGLSQGFQLWVRKMFPEIIHWDRMRMTELYKLLFEAGCLFMWVEKQADTHGRLSKHRQAMLASLDEIKQQF